MASDFRTKAFKMDGFNDEAGTVEGYASTFGGGPDKAGDIVEPGAFKTAVLQGPERVRFLWEHDRKSVIGKITDMREDDRGLYVKAQFANTRQAQETRDLMKMGAVDSFSIGYRVLQEKKSSFRGKSVNLLQNVHLLEVSCVAWPCNVEARMTAIKSEISDRFDDLNLEQQALVGKFIDYLEGEQKSEPTVIHATEDQVEQVELQPGDEVAEDVVVIVTDEKSEEEDLSGILNALELHNLAMRLK